MDQQNERQPTERISDIVHGAFANPFKKGASALFLVCLDEAGDDYEKIAKLNDVLNSYLDDLEQESKATPTT